ncbi:MAG: DUF72 domain-containing protein [Thermoguttaceae bacterium]|nr:DUF72 domain-containing protein [Thermoguttaceae bacterium]MDW8077407.1 DUF72 domain-containing protein [Thermoguttaceae bacterium]
MVRRRPQILVGTSGWTYDDWKGIFYPPELPPTERITFYASHFPAVELNASFYRLPTQNMIEAWNKRLPDDFHMAVKGWRTVTHLAKLQDCQENVNVFLSRVKSLKTLRVILWQLPPSLHFDIERLDAFLGALPEGFRYAVEFRHASWWRTETVELLTRHKAAFVAVSHPRLPADVYPTCDFLYIRFHGLGKQLYRYNYSQQELAEWVDRVGPHLNNQTIYAFFNNDWEGHAVRNARQFSEMLLACSHSSARKK